MSSANRGRARNKDDLYQTPHWLVEAIIPAIAGRLVHVKKPRVWEPCAGHGRISRVLKHLFPHWEIFCSDIQDFDGVDRVLDFLDADTSEFQDVDLIISNPPFLLAQDITQHAQTLIKDTGSVMMLERLNFFGTKKREPWLRRNMPNSHISPRRASYLPTKQCDSIEYTWLEFQSQSADQFAVKHIGTNELLPTMLCGMCHGQHYDKVCKTCDYGYCSACLPAHDCQRNLFGKSALWYCCNHPDKPMTNACRAKGCSQSFCKECWAEHVPTTKKPLCLEI